MLNPVARKWVEALRSGEYEQGNGRLKTPEGKFCCLGVLAELAKEEGISNTSENYLNDPVLKWSGVAFSSGEYYVGGRICHLSVDNDSGMPFSQIADIIEAEPRGLFAE